MKLKCDTNTKIVVLKASYGRTHSNEEVCPSNARGKDTNCHAATSVDTVKEKCNGKTECSVRAKNKVFGDPCRGTFKYLTVSYQCVE